MSTFLMTDKGRQLMAKIEAGDLPLKITRLLSGAGTGSNIEQQTGVISPMKELSITDKQVENDQLTITTIMTNEGLSTGYDMWQIGIYAEDPDDGEILYRIMQFESSRRVPAEAETVWAYAPEITVATGNASTVEVNVDQTGYASKADIEILRESLRDHISDTDLHVTADKKTTWDGAATTANEAKTAAQNAQSTADSAKATAEAAIPASQKGAAGGVASLGADGKVPAGQLPAMDYDDKGSAAAVQSNLNSHAGDGNLHVTAAKQSSWDGAITAAAAAHGQANAASNQAAQGLINAEVARVQAVNANTAAANAMNVATAANARFTARPLILGNGASVGSFIGNNAVVMGNMAYANNEGTTALGSFTNAYGTYGTAVGNNASAGPGSVSIGYGSNSNSSCVSIGNNAHSFGVNSVAIGRNTTANMSDSIAIGCQSISGYYAVALGYNAGASGNNAVAIGHLSLVGSIGGVGLGYNARVQGINGVSIGFNSRSFANCVAIGSRSVCLLEGGIAIGPGANSNGHSSVALGASAAALNGGTVAIGSMSEALGYNATAVGTNSEVLSVYQHSSAFGYNAKVSATNSIRLGSASTGELAGLYCVRNITTTSDARDKTDIKPVENALDFLNSLQMIQYVDNNRWAYSKEELTEEEQELKNKYSMHRDLYDTEAHAAGSKKGERKRVGVLAQEVQEKMLEIYGTDNYAELVHDNLYDRKQEGEEFPEGVEEQLAVNYTGFIPFLIQAVQEITKRLEKLEDANE